MSLIFWIIIRALPAARVFRCIFFSKKDAAAPANAAMAVNKVRRSRPGLTAHPIYRPRNKRLPHPGSLVARTPRCLVNPSARITPGTCLPDVGMIAFCSL